VGRDNELCWEVGFLFVGSLDLTNLCTFLINIKERRHFSKPSIKIMID
jgi:hypothetical protein